MEYADEPRLIFSPLNEHDYCKFYNLEMADYVDDVPFYTALFDDEDQVLELGCGTGRLTRILALSCKHITGVDRSIEMLEIAESNPLSNVTYMLMDMLDISFSISFDVIIIPYNTINLLGEKALIEKCLQLCSRHLKENGTLAIQAYHPDIATKKTSEAEKQFQFAIFDDHLGGRIIKETLKWFDKSSATLNLEERYRVRPAGGGKGNRDLRHTLKLYTPEGRYWKTLLQESGFSIKQTLGNSAGKPFHADTDTTLFIHARKT